MYNSVNDHIHTCPLGLITLDGSIIIIIVVFVGLEMPYQKLKRQLRECLERIIKTLIKSYLAFQLKPLPLAPSQTLLRCFGDRPVT